MAKIFISYSRRDVDFATRLKEALETNGHTVWIDLADISVGSDWSDTIQIGLDDSEVMLVILSPDSMQSKNVGDEFKYFLDEGKPVIPVYWRDCKVFFQLRRLQYVDFRGDFDTSLNELLERLANRGRVIHQQPLPTQSAPRQNFWLGVITLAMVLALVGVGFLLLSDDDDKSTDAPTSTTTASETASPTLTPSPNTPSALTAATITAAATPTPPHTPTPRPLSEQDAEYIIRAINEGGIAAANTYVCPQEQFTEEDLTEGVVFGEVDCQREDDVMTCVFDFTISGDPKVFHFRQVFQIVDEKLCQSLSLEEVEGE